MLYHNSDLLFKHKETIERFLRMRSREIFSLGETIIFYDLTNTCFSGSAAPSCYKTDDRNGCRDCLGR